MSRFVLKGDICYSISQKQILTQSGYVVCVDGVSDGVYQTLPQEYHDFPIQDCSGMLIIPGMTDLHIHAPQFAFRGMGMDGELLEWLNNQTFPEEEKYSDISYAREAYTIFSRAMKNSATTRACIFATRHRKATELLMELMESTGLVTYVGKINMDRQAPEELVEESAELSAYNTFGWINAVRNQFTRTKPILTPRFVPSCSDALMEELREVQRAYNLPVQSHLSENKSEGAWVKTLCPKAAFYGDVYDEYNLFGGKNADGHFVNTIMAHCVWSEKSEIARMKENGVFIAHCPASNTNLSSGIAPIRRYLENDMRIGLGSDVAGGHSESIFRAVTDAIQVSKLYYRHVDETAAPITFEEAFYMATIGGGDFFGKVGSFEKGYAFDALVLDDTSLMHPFPLTLRQRLERAFYLSLDIMGGLQKKFVAGISVL